MTANAMQADKELCLASGMNDFLPKPVVMETLRDMLARMISVSATVDPDIIPASSSRSGDQAAVADTEALAGFDPEILLRYTMNDADLAHALAESAVQDMASEASALSQAFAAHDAAAAQRHAHTLKGLSAQIGASAISARYKELEQVFRDNDESACSPPLPGRLDLAVLDAGRVALSASVLAWRNRHGRG